MNIINQWEMYHIWEIYHWISLLSRDMKHVLNMTQTALDLWRVDRSGRFTGNIYVYALEQFDIADRPRGYGVKLNTTGIS